VALGGTLRLASLAQGRLRAEVVPFHVSTFPVRVEVGELPRLSQRARETGHPAFSYAPRFRVFPALPVFDSMGVSFAPPGLGEVLWRAVPRLAPWAAFFRRSAAELIDPHLKCEGGSIVCGLAARLKSCPPTFLSFPVRVEVGELPRFSQWARETAQGFLLNVRRVRFRFRMAEV
jgi:hypothetical protein